MRQPKNRQRHTGLLREQESLLGCQFAPRVAEKSEREHFLHALEIRLHLVVDAAVFEFMCEAAKILREHTHGRGVEQVLEAFAQAQFEHVADAERIDLANGEIGRHKIYGGRKMIGGINPAAKGIEIRFAQAKSRLGDVTDRDTYARREGFVPDARLLESGAYAFETVLDALGPDNAMHQERGVLSQEFAQEESTDESGRPGQEHLPEITRRNSGSRRFPADCLMNESTQGIDVFLTMPRQIAIERRHRCVGGGSFIHVFFPSLNS